MIKYDGDPDRIVEGVEGWRLDRVIFLGLTPARMTVTKAAKVMQVSRPTIYAMLKDGRIKRDPDGAISNRTLFDFLLKQRRKEA